jgi:hypothetical protein
MKLKGQASRRGEKPETGMHLAFGGVWFFIKN